MSFQQFNFAHGLYLWALAAIPVMWLLSSVKQRKLAKDFKLERFADKHLLPLLVKSSAPINGRFRRPMYLWSGVWALGVLTVAGPRWDFREVNAFRPNKSLVIALDLSEAMDATDTTPSRLIQARRQIQDILDDNPGLNIGLIGFGADAHLITPITEDKGAIHYLLGALRTDLVSVPGSRLAPALALADQMLAAAPDQDKAVLVMSHGNFDDQNPVGAVKTLASHGVRVSAMGFGSPEGAPIPRSGGGFIHQAGEAVVSRLNRAQLTSISDAGHGIYLAGDAAVAGRGQFAGGEHVLWRE